MPIFEYRCEDCGEKFDKFYRKLEEEMEEENHCPRCGSTRLRKLISIIGLGGGGLRNFGGCSDTGPTRSG